MESIYINNIDILLASKSTHKKLPRIIGKKEEEEVKSAAKQMLSN